ncbi:phenylalanine--tRNA ligase subunit beta [Patescibacteria group bacterium]|nr:phenylalanine--tRNA ligase subunit beta [Patescibacteria group bacterium]
MFVSLNWIKDFVDLPAKTKPQELADALTIKTAEVEGVLDQAKNFENIVTGQVVSLNPHPNADKLKIAQTSIGKETVQIVCGGENLKEGMYVAVAKIGAKVRWHGEGDLVTMEKAKIRGEESYGMICASNEIGLDNPEEGPRDIADLSALKPQPGTPLAQLLKKDDFILEFDNKTLTNRPDLWGHYGIAREVAAISGGKFTEHAPQVRMPEKGQKVDVRVENHDLCPRYCGLIIEGITVEQSPDWMKERLRATGHGTHNNIVDITNYIMTELGQPMHAFDQKNIEGGIVVRTAKKGEKITTLDGKDHNLKEDMLVIADHKRPVAVAGVMGGENSEINEKTTTIILEAANFNAASVRRTSTTLGIRTDSVQRFEKSLDPFLPLLAMQRAAQLVLELCPNAKITGPITDIKKFNEKPLVLSLDIKKAKSKIGVDIADKEIEKILKALDFKVETHPEIWKVTVPSHRSSKDVTIEDDLVEEIVRIYGYDNIPAILPSLPTKLPLENAERFKKHRVRELLSYSLGFSEAYNYSFYGEKDLKNCLMKETGHIKLLNYLSEDQTHLRTTLIPNILKNTQENLKYAPELRLYEIGRSYKEIGEFMPLEEKLISGVIAKKGRTDNPFYEAKGVVEAYLKKFNISANQAPEVENTPYAHPIKCLSYLAKNGETLAKIFMIHPQVSKNYDLDKYSVALFEINFTQAQKFEEEQAKYQETPRFPSIELDISVLIPRNTENATLKDAINKANTHLIQSIQLFDIYQGENIGPDKKAMAYKVTLQAKDRTLTDEEMTQVQQKIFKNLEALGGEIRGK